MAQKGIFARYLMIYNKIKQSQYISLEDLEKYIEKESANLNVFDDDLKIGKSKRTLSRDIQAIRDMFGIAIEYSHQGKGYYIEESNFDTSNFQRVLDEFEIFQSLNIAEEIKPFINIEARKDKGLENLYGIIHALKNSCKVEFTYNFFDINDIYTVNCEPYGMKEFKNRWYLVALDKKDNYIKTFALERISDFKITNTKFDKPKDFDLKKYFSVSFGIERYQKTLTEEIVLKFKPLQARYVKQKPLHHSQKILKETDNELTISLFLQNNFDFRMELLSYGDAVTVIKPESLKNQLIETYKKAIENY